MKLMSISSRLKRRVFAFAYLSLGRVFPRRFCPSCSGTAFRFLAHGRVVRRDAACPRCGALERQRALSLYLATLDLASMRVLHVAPERVIARVLRSRAKEYISLDLVSRNADVRADLTKGTPFRDGTFDLVVCVHVLEHIEREATALRELTRIVSPGGIAVVIVPIDENRATTYEDSTVDTPAARLAAFGHPGHVRWYGRDTGDRFRRLGVNLAEVRPSQSLREGEIRRMALHDSETLFVCEPSAAGAERAEN